MSNQATLLQNGFTCGRILNWKTVTIGCFAILLGTWITLTTVQADSPATAKWALQANYVDACSCDMACPCLFGGSPTRGYCKGATLVEITAGHYGPVDLAGVTVLAVYNSGEWIKFLVSENATKEQTDAVVEFLPVAEGFFKAPVREIRNLPIAVDRTADKVKITAEGAVIDLQQIRNAAGGPIKISGLPARGFPGLPYLDHTQYKTTVLSHDSETEQFSFSGTNGYTEGSRHQANPRRNDTRTAAPITLLRCSDLHGVFNRHVLTAEAIRHV